MRTVVVTGAGGSLGRRVVALLAARDDLAQVVAFDRRPPVPVEHPRAPVVYRQGDLSECGALEGVVGECDAVIHLAWQAEDGRLARRRSAAGPRRGCSAAGRWRGQGADGDTNLAALGGVLDAVAASRRVTQVVHLSSATVYGAWPDNPVPLVESAPLRPNPGFAYAVEKAEAERVLAEWHGAHPSVAASVLRPAVTFGAHDRPLYRALAGIGRPRALGGNRPVQLLHIDDLADAVVLVWDRRLDGTFNVAPDSGISPDTAGALAGGLQRVALPGGLVRPLSALSWRLWRGGVPSGALAYTMYPWVVAADRLTKAGWRARYSTEETLVTTDDRSHWDDLPLSRRQLVTVGGSALAAGAGVAAATLRVRARRARLAGRGEP